ncbi:AAA family ATPase [Raineya sp.]
MHIVRYPYGISNFEKIRREGQVFVDKTPFIPLLEEYSNVVYLRPRRFGKSLFVSLLGYYYDIRHKERFEALFAQLYIGKNPTALASSFRILNFNFSGINTDTIEEAKKGFNVSVEGSLREFFKNYPAVFSKMQQKAIIEAVDAEKMLKLFFSEYPEDTKIYVLIDEYDHFTNEILVKNIQDFKAVVSLNGYVRKFYETIKNATQQGSVDRFFITGVSPITLDSLTSGFNIVKHLTHHKTFEAMMGFSEAEVQELLSLVLEDKSREGQIMQDLRDYYNGYRFYPLSEQNIYNSDMVLYFLDHFKHDQTYPRQMLDPNIAPDYGKLKQMFKVANLQANLQVLEEVLEKGSVESEQIYQFHFEKDFGKKEFVNFLFYLGNLTIKESDLTGAVIFKIPNKVIEVLYWQYYAEVLQTWANLPREEDWVFPAVREMALTGSYEKFFALIEKLLQNLSNRDYIRFDEKHVKMAMIAYFSQSNIFWVQSEREVAGGGYVDIELFIRPNNPNTHHQFAIELKYLKKEQENLLTETMQEAKEQILSYYQKDTLLQSKKMLNLLAVVVVKDRVFVEKQPLPITNH